MSDNNNFGKSAIYFLQTAQWLNNEISRQLEPFDLTAQQLKILSIIAMHPDQRASVNEIKAQMLDPMSNVSRLLNKLVDKKLIVKSRDQQDQRLVYIHITKAGIELMCAGKKAMDKGMAAFEKLEKIELDQLTNLIQKLRE